MPRKLVKRLISGIVMALLLCLAAAAVSAAGPPNQSGPVREDCDQCHGSVVESWEQSAHGHALDNAEFQEALKENGGEGDCLTCHTTGFDPESGEWVSDGVACLACHEGQTGPHPETAMPTNSSSRNCSTCHVETYEEWQNSAHGEGELSCVRCHNPHTATLRAGSMEELCANCHNKESYFYNTTAHAEQDLGCTDCHLKITESPMGEGHGLREHTFAVDLETCNQCHADQMHLVGPDAESETAAITIINNPPASGDDGGNNKEVMTAEPEPATASPVNYLFVAIVGLMFGVTVTPLAENWIGRLRNRD
ncbi:MAG: multiheme c-type cytochrome [Candidatus Promineifilaceae bacterium]|jgi:predicted CXXCH cytochrome family protein